MEFLFELFAEMLGVEQSHRPDVAQTEAHEAEIAMNEQDEAEPQAVNIFNVVNFH
ncbi:MAG: hypothetical protein SOY07_03440 [Bacteroidales bacterium]|nr:hypothetical protein [Bacteroidales bacterium]